MRHPNSRLRLALGVSAVAVAAALVVTQPALAQATATLQGHVASASAGTTVTATDTVTGQSVNGTVAADGSYVIVGLRPSTYHVTAGNASEDVSLPVGVTTTLDLDAAGATTTVTVVGRPRRDVHTAEIATSVSQKQMENLPQNDRNFLNFAALAPGVSVSTGNKTFQAGGVGPDQVNVFIDGQSYKNQTAHGGVAGQAFTPGNPFPQLAVQEFKVDSQNFKAEFEQAGSAIIQAVTKTGGDEYHGDAFVEYTNKDMEARPYFDRPGNANNPNGTNPKPDYKRYQYGFDIGGPIIKNVLHFYAAGEVNDTTNPSTAVNLSDSTIPSAIKTAENGSFAAPFKQTLLFGKLTWYVNDADTLNLSGFGRQEDNNIDYGGQRTRSGARNVRSNEIEGLLEWNHRGANFLNEMSLAYQDSQIGTPDLTDGPQLSLYNGTGAITVDPMTGLTSLNTGGDVADMGAQNFTQNSGQKLYTLKDNITFTSFDWHGSHVIKAGFKYAKTTLSRAENNNTNGTYNYLAIDYSGTSTDPSSSIPFSASLNVMAPTTFHANNDNVGLFIQDDWTVNEHLTYNLGLRWDYESNMMNNKFVTPTAIVDALAAYTNWTAAGIDYHDYVSTGHNRKPFTGAFQPRLGVTYDVNGDRDMVFFAGWGRYYDRDVFLSGQIETVQDTAERIVTANFCGAAGLPTCDDVKAPLGQEDNGRIQWTSALKDPNALRQVLLANGTGGSVWLLNNKTKVPYSDNFDIGFRKRVGDATWSVSYQQNMSYHVFQYVRGNRLPDGTFTSKGDQWTEDNFPIQGQLPGFSGKLNIGESNGKSRYNAIFITVDKPYTKASHYGYTGALTIADSKSTGSELGADEYFEGPHQNTFGWNHSLGVSKYRFVGTGIVDGPWQTTISATLTLATGTPFGSVIGGIPGPAENPGIPIVNLGGVYFPKGLAYQELDARIAKDFTLPNGNVITLDGQVYNLFDHVNRAYSAWGAGSNWGGGAPLLENSTQGPARTFQVGLKYKF